MQSLDGSSRGLIIHLDEAEAARMLRFVIAHNRDGVDRSERSEQSLQFSFRGAVGQVADVDSLQSLPLQTPRSRARFQRVCGDGGMGDARLQL